MKQTLFQTWILLRSLSRRCQSDVSLWTIAGKRKPKHSKTMLPRHYPSSSFSIISLSFSFWHAMLIYRMWPKPCKTKPGPQKRNLYTVDMPRFIFRLLICQPAQYVYTFAYYTIIHWHTKYTSWYVYTIYKYNIHIISIFSQQVAPLRQPHFHPRSAVQKRSSPKNSPKWRTIPSILEQRGQILLTKSLEFSRIPTLQCPRKLARRGLSSARTRKISWCLWVPKIYAKRSVLILLARSTCVILYVSFVHRLIFTAGSIIYRDPKSQDVPRSQSILFGWGWHRQGKGTQDLEPGGAGEGHCGP